MRRFSYALAPELFSAPVLEQFEEKQQQEVVNIPYFDG